MHRTLYQFLPLEQNFIDLAYVKNVPFLVISELLGIDRKTVSQLNKDLRETWKPITYFVRKWKTKNIGGNFWDFYAWHISSEKKCFYCGITEDQIEALYESGIVNKRTTRGRVLEIDRRISSSQYSLIDNLIYSCYWCNNAKTDTFTDLEAKLIGNAISQIWRNRLRNLNKLTQEINNY